MGSKTYAEYETRIKALVKDTKLVDQLDEFIESGIIRYSHRRARLLVVELTGDGNVYSALPTSGQGWEQGFSNIMAIEYPLDANPPTYLDDDEWGIHSTPTGDRIRFIGSSYPGDTEKFWVMFTARHEVSEGTPEVNTVPDSDFEGACHACALVYAESLSRFYVGQTMPGLEADTVNHQSKAIDTDDLVKTLSKRFDELVPLEGYSTITDWDRPTIIGGTLTHEDKA